MYTPRFSALFAKEDNICDLLFASTKGQLLTERICFSSINEKIVPTEANSYKMTPLIMETKMIMAELLPLKLYSFTLNSI